MALSQTLVSRSAVAGAISSQQSAAASSPAKPAVLLKLPIDLASSRHTSNAGCFAQKVTTQLQLKQNKTARTVRATAHTASKASVAQGENWSCVLPLSAIPGSGHRMERLVGGVPVLLIWDESRFYATETRSPAGSANSEALETAELTHGGGIVCPETGTVYDLQTGEVREWCPKNPYLRSSTSPTRNLITYPVKIETVTRASDGFSTPYIFVDLQRTTGGGTEHTYKTVSLKMVPTEDGGVNLVPVDELQMQVDQS